jgi:hypothetical protein
MHDKEMVTGIEAQRSVEQCLAEGYALMLAPGEILEKIYRGICIEAGKDFTETDCIEIRIMRDDTTHSISALGFKKNDYSEKVVKDYFDDVPEETLAFRNLLLAVCLIESDANGEPIASWEFGSVIPGSDVTLAIKRASVDFAKIVNYLYANFYSWQSKKAMNDAKGS